MSIGGNNLTNAFIQSVSGVGLGSDLINQLVKPYLSMGSATGLAASNAPVKTVNAQTKSFSEMLKGVKGTEGIASTLDGIRNSIPGLGNGYQFGSAIGGGMLSNGPKLQLTNNMTAEQILSSIGVMGRQQSLGTLPSINSAFSASPALSLLNSLGINLNTSVNPLSALLGGATTSSTSTNSTGSSLSSYEQLLKAFTGSSSAGAALTSLTGATTPTTAAATTPTVTTTDTPAITRVASQTQNVAGAQGDPHLYAQGVHIGDFQGEEGKMFNVIEDGSFVANAKFERWAGQKGATVMKDFTAQMNGISFSVDVEGNPKVDGKTVEPGKTYSWPTDIRDTSPNAKPNTFLKATVEWDDKKKEMKFNVGEYFGSVKISGDKNGKYLDVNLGVTEAGVAANGQLPGGFLGFLQNIDYKEKVDAAVKGTLKLQKGKGVQNEKFYQHTYDKFIADNALDTTFGYEEGANAPRKVAVQWGVNAGQTSGGK